MNPTELFLIMVIVWLLIDDGPSCKDWWSNWKGAWAEYKQQRAAKREAEKGL